MAEVDDRPPRSSGANEETTKPTADSAPADKKTATRAYELYKMRGSEDGAALDDWLKAERELKQTGRSKLGIAMELSLLRRIADSLAADARVRVVATGDHATIRRWAELHQAEPATGEATPSGQATVVVNDAGAGIRFNFPAAALFRPITWGEWFDNFDRHHLIFVFEEDSVTNRPTAGYFHLMKARDWEEHLSYLR
jgi:hypothetical protein